MNYAKPDKNQTVQAAILGAACILTFGAMIWRLMPQSAPVGSSKPVHEKQAAQTASETQNAVDAPASASDNWAVLRDPFAPVQASPNSAVNAAARQLPKPPSAAPANAAPVQNDAPPLPQERISPLPPISGSPPAREAPLKSAWLAQGAIARNDGGGQDWIAVLSSDKTTVFARTGTVLSDGEKVVSIDRAQIVLQSGSTKFVLKIGAAQPNAQ